MKNNTTLILGIVAALIIGGGIGYFSGKNTNDNDTKTKELQSSITMMNEQATTIQKMAEIMKSSGTMMKELGTKYQEEGAVIKGKDMEIIGEKYMREAMNAPEFHSSMKQMQR